MEKLIATCCALIFLINNCNFARGYLVSIGAGKEIRGCVTNDHQHAVAFVKNVKGKDGYFSHVETFDLDGNANEMRFYDCNLVKRFGCNQWRTENLRIKSNEYKNYPAVTDFRWHDFHSVFNQYDSDFLYWGGKFKTVMPEETHHAHFSILTNSSFDFLIPPNYKDRKSDSHNLTIFEDIVSESRGQRWELFSVRFSFLDPSENMVSVNSGEKLLPKNLKDVRMSRRYMYLYTPSFDFHGSVMIKKHSYDLLVPEKSNAWMEREIEFPKETVFCVDVVYILRSPLKISENAFNVTFVTEKGEFLNFTEGHPSKEVDTWHVVRFNSLKRRFEGKGTLRLSVGPQDLEIGGIRFCPGGGLDVEITRRGMQQCHSLSTHLAPPPVEDGEEAEKFTKLVTAKWKICERINEARNCSGMNVCSSTGCFCFFGFTGDDCKTPFQKLVPDVTKIWARTIELDMHRSLKGVAGSQKFQVQYREKFAEAWKTRVCKTSMGKGLVLNLLKPETLYVIRLVWISPNQSSVVSKEIETRTKPCIPIDEETVEMKLIEAEFTTEAKVTLKSEELEELCRVTQMQVTSEDEEVLLDTMVHDWELRWDLPTCRNGSIYTLSVKDEQGNSVEKNETCFLAGDEESLEEQRVVVVAAPSKLVLSAGVVALGAVLLIVFGLFCVVCLCCVKSRRRAHEIKEQNRQRFVSKETEL
ncbi:Hypothetical predicted protein [Cloeon dipterum]|uniref:Fibronectin type-III domain-containing protein n=1 Tax=Cloeon dipterum TaxID=197152 RepID=A0A8S1E525_9INSE|nr:Hypothetical predicted protein [Cloeon dipterum]